MNKKLIENMPHEFDVLEVDPTFADFINSIYEYASAHPEKLWTSAEVWDGVEELLDGVELGEDD